MVKVDNQVPLILRGIEVNSLYSYHDARENIIYHVIEIPGFIGSCVAAEIGDSPHTWTGAAVGRSLRKLVTRPELQQVYDELLIEITQLEQLFGGKTITELEETVFKDYKVQQTITTAITTYKAKVEKLHNLNRQFIVYDELGVTE